MSENTEPIPASLSRLYKSAVNNQWAVAIYRLPGEKEPITLLQTKGGLQQLPQPFEAIGMEGFVVAPWTGDHDTPAILIKPNHTFQGWWPNIEGLELENVAKVPKGSEMNIPTIVDAPFDEYQGQIQVILSAIEVGMVEKAILSRIVSHLLPDGFNAVDALKRACEKYPQAFCYLVHIPGVGQWMGASPEVLINVQNQEVKTVALASTKNNKSLDINKLEWSNKETHEHQLVSTYISTLLKQYCKEVQIDGPKSIQAGNLFHLRTDFSAKLPTVNPMATLRSMIEALHPTPAIAGFPKQASIKLIADVEKHQRAYYAGFIGPVNGDKDIRLFVNLRCMRMVENKALLYVGGGITSGSNAQEEWDETKAKANTLLNILN